MNCASAAKSVAWSADGMTRATGSADGDVHVWRAADYQSLGVRDGHALPVDCIVSSPDGRTLASASDDETVRLWAVE